MTTMTSELSIEERREQALGCATSVPQPGVAVRTWRWLRASPRTVPCRTGAALHVRTDLRRGVVLVQQPRRAGTTTSGTSSVPKHG